MENINNENYCIMTFKSITYAIQFEMLMKKHSIDVRLIPVPRAMSSSCGMCGRFKCENKDEIIKLCDSNNITYEKIYNLDKEK